MRDIRGDLQDRVNLIKEQMSAAQNQFEKLVEQLKREHQNRLKDPVADLDAVKLVMKIEDRRLSNAAPLSQYPQDITRLVVKLAS
jgi:hypothetical protein